MSNVQSTPPGQVAVPMDVELDMMADQLCKMAARVEEMTTGLFVDQRVVLRVAACDMKCSAVRLYGVAESMEGRR